MQNIDHKQFVLTHRAITTQADNFKEEVLVYLFTEEGHSFQHFLDTLLPKLIHTLLWLSPHDRQVCKIVVRLS